MLQRLLFGLLLSIVVPLQADILIDHVHRGGNDYQCYAVGKDGVERFISTHSKKEKATAKCDTEKIKAVLEGDTDTSFRTREQGYTESVFTLTPAAEAQLFPFIKRPPATDPDAPPEGWEEGLLNNETHTVNSTVTEYDAGSSTFTCGVNGGRISGTADSFGCWKYEVPTTGDFSLTARVVTATQVGDISSKAGIMLRESDANGSAMGFLSVYSLNGTLVDVRAVTDGSISTGFLEGTTVALPECFRIEVDRDIASVKYFRKLTATDCSVASSTYDELLQEFPAWVGTEQNIYVWLANTPRDNANAGLNVSATFDQVVVSTGSISHAPGDVDFTPTSYPVNEDVTPVTLTATRTGDGVGGCTIDYATADGSAVDGTDYTSASGTLTWTTGQTGARTFDVTIIDRDGVAQGNKQFTAVLTKDVCAGDDLNADTATVTIADQDSGGAFTAMTPTNTVQKDLACFGCDWSALLSGSPDYEYKFITNLNPSGAGSFDAAVSATCAANTIRVVIPVVSGRVDYSGTTKQITCSPIMFPFHWAPDPGFHISGLNLRPKGLQYALFQHFSCFNDTITTTSAHCVTLSDLDDGNDSIVIVNPGGLFAHDSALQFTRGTTNASTINAMIQLPLFGSDPNRFGQGFLFGDTAPTATNLMLMRSVIGHAQQRCPLASNVQNAIIAENVCYNIPGNLTNLGNQRTAQINKFDILNTLYVRGPDGSAAKPIRLTDVNGNNHADADTRVYFNGNCGFGYTDTQQSDLVLNQDTGTYTEHYVTPQATRPQGFAVTDFDCGTSTERARAALICKYAGPLPGTPGRPALHQTLCDHIDNHFAGSGTQAHTASGLIGSVSEVGGMPSIAQNGPCDPFTADSCGVGKGPLPTEANADGAGAFINAFFDANQAAYCAVMPVGATGC
jgi:hypothetical protein